VSTLGPRTASKAPVRATVSWDADREVVGTGTVEIAGFAVADVLPSVRPQ
jgi:hypothetical protein